MLGIDFRVGRSQVDVVGGFGVERVGLPLGGLLYDLDYRLGGEELSEDECAVALSRALHDLAYAASSIG